MADDVSQDQIRPADWAVKGVRIRPILWSASPSHSLGPRRLSLFYPHQILLAPLDILTDPPLLIFTPPLTDHTLLPLAQRSPATDEATALSAVRNLKEVPVNGRNLRVESSTDEPGPRRGRGGGESVGSGGGGGGGGVGGGRGGGGGRYGDDSPPPPTRAPISEPPSAGRLDLHLLPPGQDVPGQRATDAISKTLAAISPGQMQDVMAGMKVG